MVGTFNSQPWSADLGLGLASILPSIAPFADNKIKYLTDQKHFRMRAAGHGHPFLHKLGHAWFNNQRKYQN